MEVFLVDVKSRKRHARRLPCVVGRGDDADFRVKNDSVSRRHCALDLVDGVVTVTDAGSTNGTFLDGRKLPPHAATPLPTGTDLRIGSILLRVEYAVAIPAASEADTVPLAAGADPADVAVEVRESEAKSFVVAEPPPEEEPPAAAADDLPAFADLAAEPPAALPAFPVAEAGPPAAEGSFDFLGVCGAGEPPPPADDALDDFFKKLS